VVPGPTFEYRNASNSNTAFGDDHHHDPDMDDDMNTRCDEEDNEKYWKLAAIEFQGCILPFQAPTTPGFGTYISKLSVPFSYPGAAQNTTCKMGLKAFLFFFPDACAPWGRHLLFQWTIGRP
jgi:hypothetical protein